MIYRILNYTTEIYNWNQAGKNNSIISPNTPSQPWGLLVCICLLERAYSNYLECSYNAWYVYDKLSKRNRTKVVRGDTSSNSEVSDKHFIHIGVYGLWHLAIYWHIMDCHVCLTVDRPKPICNAYINRYIPVQIIYGGPIFAFAMVSANMNMLCHIYVNDDIYHCE